MTEFDIYAEDYDDALAQGLAVSGEEKDYFARGRIGWLRECLRELNVTPKLVMDYGCGTGSSSALLLDLLRAESYLGVDHSVRLLEKARHTFSSEQKKFLLVDQYSPCGETDLVFSNGVFHHIPICQRSTAIDYLYRSLRSGGLLALWENNPWNPGTRYVMSRIPFDRDAVMLTPSETRRLLRDRGFQILRTEFLFIFPKILRSLRWLEPYVAGLPFGAQYMVLGLKC